MIKFVVGALWLCAVTVGAIFYSFQASGNSVAEAPADPHFGGLDYVKGNMISVPLLRKAGIEGYLMAQLVYTVDPARLKALTVPADSIITDEVYSYIYANPQIDFMAGQTLNLDEFRASIRDAINARVNEKLIHEVMVEQLDFLSKDEIRDNALRRRASETTAKAMSKSFGEQESGH